MLVVAGAPGETDYEERFAAAARTIKSACDEHAIACDIVGLDAEPAVATAKPDRDRVVEWLMRARTASATPVWLIYIGHGTWDGENARLNLRGLDLDAGQLNDALAGQARPFVFVHGGSASGPFIPALAGPDRVIIAATESGDEVNYARFGEFFADAVAATGADIDQDARTSLLEAALFAARRAQTFYEEAGRMATEHAIIEDNGDGKGTPAEWFRGTRVENKDEAGAAPDGALAHRFALIESDLERSLSEEQRARRVELEDELEALRARKSTLERSDYLRELERTLRQLAPLYADPALGDDT
ncbi:MAG: hypothetical protein ACREIA_19280 [Opitutaceae bacterium]